MGILLWLFVPFPKWNKTWLGSPWSSLEANMIWYLKPSPIVGEDVNGYILFLSWVSNAYWILTPSCLALWCAKLLRATTWDDSPTYGLTTTNTSTIHRDHKWYILFHGFISRFLYFFDTEINRINTSRGKTKEEEEICRIRKQALAVFLWEDSLGPK